MRAASVTSAIHPKVSSEAEATIAPVVIAARRAGDYRGPVPKGLQRNEAICRLLLFRGDAFGVVKDRRQDAFAGLRALIRCKPLGIARQIKETRSL